MALRRETLIKSIVLGLAAGLGTTSIVLLLRLETEARRSPPPERPPVLDPDGGLRLALFRRASRAPEEAPWRLAQSAVGAGERVFATLSDSEGRAAYVAVVLLADSGHIAWLFPPGGPPRHRRSARVTLSEVGWRVPGSVRIPDGARRVVVYGLVSRAPVDLASLASALDAARKTRGFWIRPPRLTVRQSRQTWLALDVLE